MLGAFMMTGVNSLVRSENNPGKMPPVTIIKGLWSVTLLSLVGGNNSYQVFLVDM